MNEQPWSSIRRRGGFTLIEVMGALMIFSLGVLMVLQLSAALGIQLRYAAAQSKIVVLANERLDSLEATPFDSLSVGKAADTTTVEGFSYRRGSSVSAVSPVLYQIVVTLTPLSDGAPSYSATSYLSAVW